MKDKVFLVCFCHKHFRDRYKKIETMMGTIEMERKCIYLSGKAQKSIIHMVIRASRI